MDIDDEGDVLAAVVTRRGVDIVIPQSRGVGEAARVRSRRKIGPDRARQGERQKTGNKGAEKTAVEARAGATTPGLGNSEPPSHLRPLQRLPAPLGEKSNTGGAKIEESPATRDSARPAFRAKSPTSAT